MTAKILCEGCGRGYIPSATSNPVKCAACNASNRSDHSPTSHFLEEVGGKSRVEQKKGRNLLPQNPESWGKLPGHNAPTSLCASCGEIFNSVAGFDAHRKGEEDRYCLTTDAMRKAGMSINGRGLWITREFDASAAQRLQKQVATA